MEPTPEERAEIGRRLRAAAGRRYDTAKAAYVAVDVNSLTWTNLLSGTRTRGDSMRKAVRHFWPETGGDWQLIPDEGDVLLSQATDEQLMAEVRRRRQQA